MITVFSLVARTCEARPRCSRPICSNANDDAFECTLPPQSAAMSSSRCTRFSPNPGAWIAVTLRCPLTWLCTSICSAVPSTFSATITSGRGSRMMRSSTGISERTSVIFSAVNSRYGSSRTASMLPGSVTRYGET